VQRANRSRRNSAGSRRYLFRGRYRRHCAANEPGRQWVKDPFLVVENLSPTTERHDRRVKLPVYRQIETVQEILLIASDERYAEVHRRSGTQWIAEILRGGEAMLSLASVGIEVPMAELYELYEGIALPGDAER
jgi:Uma2 family endonuclease